MGETQITASRANMQYGERGSPPNWAADLTGPPIYYIYIICIYIGGDIYIT